VESPHPRAGWLYSAVFASSPHWGGLTKTGYACFCSIPFDPKQATQHIYHVLNSNAKRYIGHNPVGSLVIYAMLVKGLAAVASGWLVFNEGD